MKYGNVVVSSDKHVYVYTCITLKLKADKGPLLIFGLRLCVILMEQSTHTDTNREENFV